MHPQLGQVEIGGWDKMNYWRNPAAAAARARGSALSEVDDDDRACRCPKLELLRTEVRALGPDTWRVRLAVANSGWLPAYVTKRALQRKTVRGVMFEIHLPESDRSVPLVSGKPRMEGPQLEGHAPKNSLNASCRARKSRPIVPSASGSCGRRRERGWHSALAPIGPASCGPRSSSTETAQPSRRQNRNRTPPGDAVPRRQLVRLLVHRREVDVGVLETK
jgi:hypothetical protein